MHVLRFPIFLSPHFSAGLFGVSDELAVPAGFNAAFSVDGSSDRFGFVRLPKTNLRLKIQVLISLAFWGGAYTRGEAK